MKPLLNERRVYLYHVFLDAWFGNPRRVELTLDELTLEHAEVYRTAFGAVYNRATLKNDLRFLNGQGLLTGRYDQIQADWIYRLYLAAPNPEEKGTQP